MSDLFFTIAAFLVALAILITVHEFGHFWVARKLGVRILKFSIGFGPALLRWVGRRDGTEYVIASLPLGGYVKMLDEREEAVPESDLHRAFNRQALWKRSAIVAAGPLFNLLFAALVFWGILVSGEVGTRPLVGSVTAESMADTAGFANGDELLRVADRRTPTWESAVFALMVEALEGRALPVRVREASGAEVVRWLDGRDLGALVDSPTLLGDLGLKPARPVVPAVIGEALPGGVAERVGLLPGDRILAALGKPVGSWDEWVTIVREHPGTQIPIRVERDGASFDLTLIPETLADGDRQIGRIGAAVQVPEGLPERYKVEVRLGPVAAVGAALAKTADMTALTVRVIGRILIGQVSVKNLSGPITIAETAGKTASNGLLPFVKFLAVVSISIAVLNLIPIPVLDGGHLLYFFIEWIKGRPLSGQFELRGQQIGVLLLAALITLAFYVDLSRLLG